MSGLLAHEAWLRTGCFVAVLTLMALWEALAPRRARLQTRSQRWVANLGMMLISTVVVRVVVPVAAVAFAAQVESADFGLFQLTALPAWLEVLLALVLLDLAIYGQHVLFHHVPLLWRLHRVHHADLDLDVTSGVRFHPLEILLSALIKLAVIALLGAPAVAVLLFEVVLNAAAMFNHANVSLPLAVDRALRLLVVTPDMHRVHHSVHVDETNSNFGFNLPWWDRLFGTYRAQPRDGHEQMQIGLERMREPHDNTLPRLLLQPWRRLG